MAAPCSFPPSYVATNTKATPSAKLDTGNGSVLHLRVEKDYIVEAVESAPAPLHIPSVNYSSLGC